MVKHIGGWFKQGVLMNPPPSFSDVPNVIILGEKTPNEIAT
jgi:hypothetical protein